MRRPYATARSPYYLSRATGQKLFRRQSLPRVIDLLVNQGRGQVVLRVHVSQSSTDENDNNFAPRRGTMNLTFDHNKANLDITTPSHTFTWSTHGLNNTKIMRTKITGFFNR